MFKKFATFFILILVAVCMVGCASVDYTRIYSTDGVIIDDVTITLNKDVFDTYAKADAIVQAVKTDVQAFDLAISAWVKENFSGKYDGMESMEEYFAKGYTVGISSEVEETEDSYSFYFFIKYHTLQHFIYFYGLNTEDVILTYGLYDVDEVKPFMVDDFGPFISQILKGNYDIDEESLLINNYLWSKDNAYQYFINMEKTTGEKYYDCYIDKANTVLDGAYTSDNVLENVVVTERYETTENRYHSDNMYRDYNTGYIVHEWQIEDVSDSITFVRHRPEQVAWYVMALVISMVVLVILLFVFRKKGDKE
ncbi:MAG: hypothetical protein E7361_01810 [Clostridiales bacterium]|nr:hypothetical protein [Clostridiales bacterium]